ncbi:MAG TPA: hypothetical protein VKE96_13710 [Vicinamibacterales bacterium]|nr:hypothetical protein [Vicinamibacterales bacterium]
MGLPELPGRTFEEMVHLVTLHNLATARNLITDGLLLAIFWEETIFNNVFQTKGTAVGFGQVEPASFASIASYKIGLPPTRKVGKKTFSTKPLTDVQAVKASSAVLDDLFKKGKSLKFALDGYAGLEYAKEHPEEHPTYPERIQTIARWKTCGPELDDILSRWHSSTYARVDKEREVLGALGQSRGFKSKFADFQFVLFP